MKYAIQSGDVVEVLRRIHDCSFDAAFFDPPYGLSFMGKAWDYDVPSVEVFRELLRVLKPGAPVIFFGGTRTFHRMACDAEDAGLELRDCIAWMYGSGFPKSLDVSKAIDKAAGAERPVVGSRVLTGSAAMSTAEKGGTYASNKAHLPDDVPCASHPSPARGRNTARPLLRRRERDDWRPPRGMGGGSRHRERA